MRARGPASALLPLLLLAAPAAAQQVGRIEGTVTDSLGTPRPFAGAEVWVVGSAHRAVADEQGRFRIDGVPAGRWSVALVHETLDSLGLPVPPVPVAVEAGRAARLRLGTPSGAALFARACGRRPAAGEGAALGVVRDAERDAPVRGAQVTAGWVEWTVPQKGRMVKPEFEQRLASTVTDSLGQFVVCGVPNGLELEIGATADGLESGAVPLSLAERAVVMVRLHVGRPAPAGVAAGADTAASAASPPSDRAAGARIQGRVLGPDGRPVVDALVMLDGADGEARTDSAGSFHLAGLPAGTRVLFVRALGWAPRRQPVLLRRDRPAEATVTLERTVTTLPTVNVVGLSGGPRSFLGFEQRRRTGFGHFLAPDEVERWRAAGTAGMIRMLPRVRVVRPASGMGDEQVLLERFGDLCAPDIFIDGVYQAPNQGTLDMMLPARYVRAVEVYRDVEIPSQFQRPNFSGPACGAVVLWSLPPGEK